VIGVRSWVLGVGVGGVGGVCLGWVSLLREKKKYRREIQKAKLDKSQRQKPFKGGKGEEVLGARAVPVREVQGSARDRSAVKLSRLGLG
jgi:hypothetical protein